MLVDLLRAFVTVSMSQPYINLVAGAFVILGVSLVYKLTNSI